MPKRTLARTKVDRDTLLCASEMTVEKNILMEMKNVLRITAHMSWKVKRVDFLQGFLGLEGVSGLEVVVDDGDLGWRRADQEAVLVMMVRTKTALNMQNAISGVRDFDMVPRVEVSNARSGRLSSG